MLRTRQYSNPEITRTGHYSLNPRSEKGSTLLNKTVGACVVSFLSLALPSRATETVIESITPFEVDLENEASADAPPGRHPCRSGEGPAVAVDVYTDANGVQVFVEYCADGGSGGGSGSGNPGGGGVSGGSGGGSIVTQPSRPRDTDRDGIIDSEDNCDNVVNPGQENYDNDQDGDMCDPDIDNDFLGDGFDPNPFDPDVDRDGRLDGDPSEIIDTDKDGLDDLAVGTFSPISTLHT